MQWREFRGTSFFVESTEAQTEVTVGEGRVRLRGVVGPAVTLGPLQRARVRMGLRAPAPSRIPMRALEALQMRVAAPARLRAVGQARRAARIGMPFLGGPARGIGPPGASKLGPGVRRPKGPGLPLRLDPDIAGRVLQRQLKR